MVEQIVKAGVAAGKEALIEARKVLEERDSGFEPVTSLAVFLASDESDGLTGRLISAIWDDWRSLDKDKIGQIMKKDY
jgi:3-oxoacyl-[acyl-carrier protein] reductase